MFIYFYKIICKDETITDCYVGSTKNMKNRIKDHKTLSITKNFKVYEFIKNNGGWDNWKFEVMITIELDDDGDDRYVIEQQYIESEHATLNMIKSYVTPEELKKNISKKNHKYYNNNIEKEAERKRIYRSSEINKETEKKSNLLWRKNNREKINEYKREYRKKNKVLK